MTQLLINADKQYYVIKLVTSYNQLFLARNAGFSSYQYTKHFGRPMVALAYLHKAMPKCGYGDGHNVYLSYYIYNGL